MFLRCCFHCCMAHHQIHPLENVTDVKESLDEEEEEVVVVLTGDEEDEEDILIPTRNVTEVGGNILWESQAPPRVDELKQKQKQIILTERKVTRTVSSKMETRSSIESASNREQTDLTPMHAAAVNGDKSSLSKLLISFIGDINAGDKFARTPLIYCVLGDRPDCAEMLLKAGAEVNKKDIGGRTALHWAAHKGHFKCLKLLLSKGASWKEKDNEGQTPMHLSTRHKSPKCLVLLMKQLEPGEVDDQDKNKRTALHWAASYGNLDHVKMLIKQDSNIGIPDVEGKTPLHWAASSKEEQAVDCVILILETAPSVINWQDYEGRTALHLAVADGNEAVVNALTSLEKCSVSALDNVFRTPLHWAAVLGHSRIVSQLLNSKADYCSSDSNGATPLHYAAQNNYAETVEGFLGRKGLKDEPDLEGRTAFMWAAGKGADDVISCFFSHGVDMIQTDKNGGTALHAAALAGYPSTVKLLLEHGAHINMTDLQKHTPLFRACEMGHTDVVQALIDHGAKVDVVDQDGRSPLHWAALGGHAYICQTLIKYGIDPDVRDNSGRTPLQCAAYGGFVNCMSVLIENQANPNAQDSEGMAALHWACSKGHLDSVKLLIEFHAFPNHMEYTEDRYTPLDYGLMGEHYDVAQYMIEQGALSITGIQDIAALKIQAVFRGYRVRKTFLERKKLLMKHEQLRKDAAKKKAEDEYKRKDTRNKKEAEEQRHVILDKMYSSDSESASKTQCETRTKVHSVSRSQSQSDSRTRSHSVLRSVSQSNGEDKSDPSVDLISPPDVVDEGGGSEDRTQPGDREGTGEKPGIVVSSGEMLVTDEGPPGEKDDISQDTISAEKSKEKKDEKESATQPGVVKRRKKGKEIPPEVLLLQKKKEVHKVVKEEHDRLGEHRRKNHAAGVIQRAWRRYHFYNKGVWQEAKETIREKRLKAGEDEWYKQIAALTIQLAWRKYYRRKLLKSLTPKNRRILHMWDPDLVAAKQRALVEGIYGEKQKVPEWYPKLKNPDRPTWFKVMPSAAAVSYNFAIDQYQPMSKKYRNSWGSYEFMESSATPKLPTRPRIKMCRSPPDEGVSEHKEKELGPMSSLPNFAHCSFMDLSPNGFAELERQERSSCDDFGKSRPSDSFQPHHYSYNMYD